MSESLKPTPLQSLEMAWRDLEATYHPPIEFPTDRHKAIAIWGRAMSLRNVLRSQSLLLRYDDGSTILYSPHEVPLVPVGGQGLTDEEQRQCKRAGQAMAEIFQWEANQGQAL
jgi:hypothetical protein